MKPQIIAIVPVYNEEKMVLEVLNAIHPRVNHLIVINDGSTDSSLSQIRRWMQEKANVHCLCLPQNVGASGALLRGYVLLLELAKNGVVKETDLAIELDADGQHDPKYITQLHEHWLHHRVDVVQACRDFSNYPRYKVFGNRLFTLIASLLSGYRYRDVASNYRIMQVGVYKDLVKYFTGYRYSGSFEAGIILGSLGKTIDNSFPVKVPYYRSGSNFWDGFHVLAAGLWTCLKLFLGLQRTQESLAALKTIVQENYLVSEQSALSLDAVAAP